MHREMNTVLLFNILSGNAEAKEKELFEKWLEQSPQNREYFRSVKIIWEHLGSDTDKRSFDIAAAKEKIRYKIRERSAVTRDFKVRFRIVAAASIILLLSLAYFLFGSDRSGKGEYAAYNSGDTIREITLDDDSRIWLNANSSLYVPGVFSRNQRKAELKGEAYFEIARDEKRPFKIRAGKILVEVLGTTFNLSTDTLNGNVSIVVNSGSVSFSSFNSLMPGIVLGPGEKAEYLASVNQINASENEDPNYLSWKTGILTFYDTPMEDVCHRLSRHFSKEVIAVPTASRLSLTGNFRNETLEDILLIIGLTLDVEMKYTPDTIFVFK
jgi:ferric-dicitrate binding protein FerR (iron transport regulator)